MRRSPQRCPSPIAGYAPSWRSSRTPTSPSGVGAGLYRVREFRSPQELDEFLSEYEHRHRSVRRRLDTIGVRIARSR